MPITAHSLRIRFDRFELDEPDARLRREGSPVLLPLEAQQMLEAASVCGVDSRARAVAEMLGRDPMDIGQQ